MNNHCGSIDRSHNVNGATHFLPAVLHYHYLSAIDIGY